jgi:hypothetical protein
MINTGVKLWLSLAIVYLAFTYWYTNTDGPLTASEVSSYAEKYADKATAKQLDMNPTPASNPMFDADMNGMNADQLLEHYMEHMYPALFKRARRTDALSKHFDERHAYKLTALTKTIAFPVDVRLSLADPRLLLAMLLLILGLIIDRALLRYR